MRMSRWFEMDVRFATRVGSLGLVLLCALIMTAHNPPAIAQTSVGVIGCTFIPFEPLRINYTLEQKGQVSLAVYDAAGTLVRTLKTGVQEAEGEHHAQWDGLDRYGNPMPVGKYEWRLLVTPGFTAKYVGTLGTNAVPEPYEYWYGNHSPPTSVVTDGKWVYMGSQGENVPASAAVSMEGDTLRWLARQRIVAGRDMSLALDDQWLYSLTVQAAEAGVHLIEPQTGKAVHAMDVRWDPKFKKGQIDYRLSQMTLAGKLVVVSYPAQNALRWYDPTKVQSREKANPLVAQVKIAGPVDVAGATDGSVFVISEGKVLRVTSDGQITTVIAASRLMNPWRLACVIDSDQLLVAERDNSHVVKRFSISDGKLLASHGRAGGRLQGPFNPQDFRNINDITSDHQGGFIVQEGGGSLRRTSHFDAQGRHVRTWYGSQQFFNYASPDPADPSHIFYRSDYGSKTLAHMNLQTGQWEILEDYLHDDFDGLFPSAGHYSVEWNVRRRGDQLFLAGNSGRHWGIVRVDQTGHKLVPVATAGVLFKFDRKPIAPMLAKAMHNAGMELDKRPTDLLFTWSDDNADEQISADEIRVIQRPEHLIANTAQVDIDHNWNVRLSTLTGWLTIPNIHADQKTNIPFWDIQNIAETRGWDITQSDRPEGWTPRGIFHDHDQTASDEQGGSVYQSMIGQASPRFDRPAHGWPTLTHGASRLVKRRADGALAWSVGTHAVTNPHTTIYEPHPAGQFHDLQAVLGKVNLGGQNDCIVFGDRVVRPAVVYTQDGLYAGSFFDHRADDGVSDRAYGWWRTAATQSDCIVPYDVLTSGSIQQLNDHEVLWLAMGNQNTPAYRISGWTNWQRQQGSITLSQVPSHASLDGSGLLGTYFDNTSFKGKPVASRVDEQLWFGLRNGKVINGGWGQDEVVKGIDRSKPFGVRWTGTLNVPFTEPFTLAMVNRSQPGPVKSEAWEEQLAGARVWINGRLVLEQWDEPSDPDTAEDKTEDKSNITNRPTHPASKPVLLVAGASYQITVEYAAWGNGPAEFSLLWESPSLERQRIRSIYLKPAEPQLLPRLTLKADRTELHESTQEDASTRQALVTVQIDEPLEHDFEVALEMTGVDASVIEPWPQKVVIKAGQTASKPVVIRTIDNATFNGGQALHIHPKLDGRWRGDIGSSSVSIRLIDDEFVTRRGLVLYWPLDDLDITTAQDASGNGQSGRVAGPFAGTSDEAVHGRSLYFDGSDNTLYQRQRKVELAGQPYSVSLWFLTQKPDAGLIRYWRHASHSRSVWIQDNMLWAHGLRGAQDQKNTGVSVSQNQWHHLVLSINATHVDLYLDGRKVMAFTGQTQMTLPGSALHIGTVYRPRSDGGSVKLQGYIDDVRLYDHTLEPLLIQHIYEIGIKSIQNKTSVIPNPSRPKCGGPGDGQNTIGRCVGHP